VNERPRKFAERMAADATGQTPAVERVPVIMGEKIRPVADQLQDTVTRLSDDRPILGSTPQFLTRRIPTGGPWPTVAGRCAAVVSARRKPATSACDAGRVGGIVWTLGRAAVSDLNPRLIETKAQNQQGSTEGTGRLTPAVCELFDRWCGRKESTVMKPVVGVGSSASC
jgi:hypothetical protein